MAENITDLIGNTPLVRLRSFDRDFPGIEIWAKCEFMNPGGSVKDRAAHQMIQDAIASGALTQDKEIIDSSSGNTGIAYSLIGGALGYKVTLVLPANVSWARRKISEAFGTKLVFSSHLEGSDGAIRLCRELVDEDPERYFYPNQYGNESNPRGHYQSTGREILGADRRPGHPLRHRHRHQRHGDGHRATPEGLPHGDPGVRGRARRCPARARGAQAHGQLDRARTSTTRRSWTASCRSPPRRPGTSARGCPPRRASWSATRRAAAVAGAVRIASGWPPRANRG